MTKQSRYGRRCLTRNEHRRIVDAVYSAAVGAAAILGVVAFLTSGPQANADQEAEQTEIKTAVYMQAPKAFIEPEEAELPAFDEDVYNIEAQPREVLRFIGEYRITGYDVCVECCGKTDGITASGTVATVGRTVAAPEEIPFGTRLYIEGIGDRIVEDRGGSITGNKLDVLCNDHQECYEITKDREVYIIEEVWE